MLRSLLKSCKQVAEGLVSPVPLGPRPQVLFAFTSPSVVDAWHVFSDACFGGRSAAALCFNADEQAAEFSGRVTDQQAAEASDLARAGYAVASSKVTALGDYWDLSGTTHLVMRVKGDGRAYIANVRTDSLAGTGGDVWQAPFRTRPGVWDDISIPIDSLALTFQGQLVERKLEFQADKVISVGVAVSVALADAAAAAAAAARERGSGETSSSGSGAQQQQAGAQQQQAGAQQEASSSGAAAAAAGGGDVGATAAAESGAAAGDEDVPAHERFRILIREIRTRSDM